MSGLFITVLNMSLTASYVALAVMIVRLLLRKAPKSFSYVLWGVVLFRLLCSFSFESPLSLIPGERAAIPHEIVISQNPVNTGIGFIDGTVNQSIHSSLPPFDPAVSVNPMAVVMEIAAAVWLLGIVLLLCYSAVSYFRLKNRLFTATLVKDNIFETDRIQAPFVLGLIKPRIYIPTGLAQKELDYILEHEQVHIRRRDYLIKPAAFLALVLHWFNPLIWISYFLMAKDMEMSCDEIVMKRSDRDIRKCYSNSLLTLSVKQSGLLSPLAFGESNVKSRIKNVLNYKRPAFWVSAAALIAVVVLAVSLISNAVSNEVNVIDQAPMKGLELFVWKNKEVAGTNDTYYTLLPGTNRKKEEREIYDLSIAVDSIDKLNELLDEYSTGTELHIYQMNTDEFTKVEMEAIADKIKFPSGGNGVITIGLWQQTAVPEGSISAELSIFIEKNLEIIMSSPVTSSNPQDYINAHQNEYENIIKLGDQALNYLLLQFGNGQDPFAESKGKGVRVNDDLRGHIMMQLCKDILGDRNNVTDETLSPQAWFSQLSIYEETKLTDFVYDGDIPILKLVYDTEIGKNINPYRGGFIVVASKIHAYYEEGNKLKVFVTTYYGNYHLYDKVVSLDGAGVVPAAITYVKNQNGNYSLEEYKQAMDGSDFAKSIQDYCTMPESGKKIAGLADKILNHYGNYGDIVTLHRENLIKHLKANDQTGIKLRSPIGEIIPLT